MPARNPGAGAEVFGPAHPALEFAVDGERLVYTSERDPESGGVWDVDHPGWHPAP